MVAHSIMVEVRWPEHPMCWTRPLLYHSHTVIAITFLQGYSLFSASCQRNQAQHHRLSTLCATEGRVGRVAAQTWLLLLFLLIATPAIAEPIDPSDVRVIDGDTIRVYHQQPNVRLVGFNAPETRKAECAAEEELGAKATRRLRDLIRAGHLEFQYVRCSCLPKRKEHLRATTEEIAER